MCDDPDCRDPLCLRIPSFCVRNSPEDEAACRAHRQQMRRTMGPQRKIKNPPRHRRRKETGLGMSLKDSRSVKTW